MVNVPAVLQVVLCALLLLRTHLHKFLDKLRRNAFLQISILHNAMYVRIQWYSRT